MTVLDYVLIYVLIGTILTWLFERLNIKIAAQLLDLDEEEDRITLEEVKDSWTMLLRGTYIVFWPWHTLIFLWAFITNLRED